MILLFHSPTWILIPLFQALVHNKNQWKRPQFLIKNAGKEEEIFDCNYKEFTEVNELAAIEDEDCASDQKENFEAIALRLLEEIVSKTELNNPNDELTLIVRYRPNSSDSLLINSGNLYNVSVELKEKNLELRSENDSKFLDPTAVSSCIILAFYIILIVQLISHLVDIDMKG